MIPPLLLYVSSFFHDRFSRKGFLPHSCGAFPLWYAMRCFAGKISISDGHLVFKVLSIDERPY